MRTGSDYLRSLNDGRQVFVDGERVKDVTAHLAFREAARSIERLKDARKRSLPMRNRRVDALRFAHPTASTNAKIGWRRCSRRERHR